MTELFLDNQRVFLSENTQIKIKSENVYLTKSSKYTLDVEIPLIGTHNNAIVFKHINRIDVGKSVRTFKARLVANNVVVLDGIATLTGINDTSVKVQLLSGNAELNFQSKNSDLYIDELDLGKIPTTSEISPGVESNKLFQVFVRIQEESERYKRMFGAYGETDVVCLPIYNETKDFLYNDMRIRSLGPNSTTIFLPDNRYGDPTHGINGIWYRSSLSQCAPQPYFCYIIRKIFEVLGYDIAENYIENTKMRNVFIANAKPTLVLQQMLPHWTVSEFLTEIENFFGVIIHIDDTTRVVRIIQRNEFYDADEIFIEHVNDEYSVACEESETNDISNGNIGYDFSEPDPFLKINKDILQNYEELIFKTYAELETHYESLSEGDREKYIYSAEGKQYIHYVENTNKRLKEVNQFRNLLRNPNSTDVDVEMKIVPVKMCKRRTAWDSCKYDDFFKRYYSIEGVDLDAVMMCTSSDGGDESTIDDYLNIQKSIENESTTSSNNNVIEVAMNDGIMQKITTDDGKSSHVFPWPFVLTQDLLTGEKNRGFSFELNAVPGRETMYDATFNQVMKINTQSEIIFKFISSKMHNVMTKYILNNKSYVCKMIEYTIDQEGIKQEKTGYFYEYSTK